MTRVYFHNYHSDFGYLYGYKRGLPTWACTLAAVPSRGSDTLKWLDLGLISTPKNLSVFYQVRVYD